MPASNAPKKTTVTLDHPPDKAVIGAAAAKADQVRRADIRRFCELVEQPYVRFEPRNTKLSRIAFDDKLFVCGRYVREMKQFDMVKKAVIGLILSAFLAAVAFVALIVLNGFPYKYMDLNDSGFVSPREALRSLDMGIRDADVGGKECVELYALKDAQAIKQVCVEA